MTADKEERDLSNLPEGWEYIPIADAISGLEMKVHKGPDELVVGAIVLMKIIDQNGDVAMRGITAGLDWLSEIGILTQAQNDAAEPMSLRALRNLGDD